MAVKEGRRVTRDLFFIAAALVLFFDQLNKALIVKAVSPGEEVWLIDGILSLTLTYNTGAGFGILQGARWFLAAFSLAVVVAIVVLHRRIIHDQVQAFLYALVLGGAASNMIDRVMVGAVVDFIDFQVWPAFNLADAALTVGVIGLIAHAWWVERRARMFGKTVRR